MNMVNVVHAIAALIIAQPFPWERLGKAVNEKGEMIDASTFEEVLATIPTILTPNAYKGVIKEIGLDGMKKVLVEMAAIFKSLHEDSSDMHSQVLKLASQAQEAGSMREVQKNLLQDLIATAKMILSRRAPYYPQQLTRIALDAIRSLYESSMSKTELDKFIEHSIAQMENTALPSLCALSDQMREAEDNGTVAVLSEKELEQIRDHFILALLHSSVETQSRLCSLMAALYTMQAIHRTGLVTATRDKELSGVKHW